MSRAWTRRARRACAISSAVVALLGAGRASPAAPTRQSAEDEVERLERRQAAAVVDGDLATLDRIYAEDFRFTHGTGEVQSKTEWLDDLRTGRRDYASRELDRVEVEVHGDVAVTYGHLRVSREMDGVEAFFLARYVRVYQRRDDRWQLISHRTVEQRATSPGAERDG